MTISEKEDILSAIKSGNIKMKPKWHFVLRTALLVIGTVLALLVLLFIASFIVFMLRRTGLWFVPGFGGYGILLLVRSLPWILIFLVITFGVLLEIFVRQYSFGYGRPLLYSALAVALIAIMGGFVLEMTPIHRGLYASARNDQLPFGGGIYRRYGGGMMNHKQMIIAGNILSVTSTGITILTPRDEEIFLIIDKQTGVASSTQFENGDAVAALIKREGDLIKVEMIRKIEDEMHFPRRRGPGKMRGPIMRVHLEKPVM